MPESPSAAYAPWAHAEPRFRPPPGVTLYVPVVVALLVQVIGTIGASWWTRTPLPWSALSVTLAALGALALLGARRWPGPTVTVVALLAVADLFVPPEAGPPFVALVFAIIGAVVRGARTWALAATGAAWLVAVVGSSLVGTTWHPLRIAFTTVGLALCFVIGEVIRTRRERVAAYRTRLAQRRMSAEEAERLRIARELHDVLAHSLSQISVQSGVALHLFDRDPEKARESLANIRQLSTSGLDEVRGVLGFLRGSTDTAPVTPQPQLADLSRLVAQRSGLGLAVRVDDRTSGTDGIPSAIQTTAYRIAQEALTNVVRHSAASTATVTLDREGDDLVLAIVDDGTGIRDHDGGPGGGIQGMTERADLVGGTLEIDAIPSGGTRVRALLPWGGPR